jgi:hypothetical protein
LGEEGKEKKMVVNNLKYFTSAQGEGRTICTGGQNDMYWKGGGKEGKGRVTEGVEVTKVKHSHTWDTLRKPFGY